MLPFRIIETAASGDIDAINKVLKHYEGYIIALSTRRLYDEDGNTHYFVDEEVRRTLEIMGKCSVVQIFLIFVSMTLDTRRQRICTN